MLASASSSFPVPVASPASCLPAETPGAIIGRRLVEEALFLNPQFERLDCGRLIGAQCCGCGAAVRNWPVLAPADVCARKRNRKSHANRLRFAFGTDAPVGSPADFAVALYTNSFQRWAATCSLCGRDRRGRSHMRIRAAKSVLTLGQQIQAHMQTEPIDPMFNPNDDGPTIGGKDAIASGGDDAHGPNAELFDSQYYYCN